MHKRTKHEIITKKTIPYTMCVCFWTRYSADLYRSTMVSTISLWFKVFENVSIRVIVRGLEMQWTNRFKTFT